MVDVCCCAQMLDVAAQASARAMILSFLMSFRFWFWLFQIKSSLNGGKITNKKAIHQMNHSQFLCIS
jgi:hypothetical protein